MENGTCFLTIFGVIFVQIIHFYPSMLMRYFFPFFVVASLLAPSCSQYFYYRPAHVQAEGVQQIYTHGIPTMRVNENSIDLHADLTSRGQRDMNVGIAIRNESDSVFNFIPESVRVFGFDSEGRKTPFRVFSAQQFIRHRNTRNAIIAGAVVVATVATVVAIQSDGRGSVDNNNNVWRGDEFFWAISAFPNMIIVNSGAPAAPFYVPSDGLLRPHTLLPGEELRGIVKVQARPGFTDKIQVEIPIDGQYRSFLFDRRERRM